LTPLQFCRAGGSRQISITIRPIFSSKVIFKGNVSTFMLLLGKPCVVVKKDTQKVQKNTRKPGIKRQYSLGNKELVTKV